MRHTGVIPRPGRGRPRAAAWLLATVLGMAAAAAAPAPAEPPNPAPAAQYTAALLAEAGLEEAWRSLRAGARYAEAAGLPESAGAAAVAARAEAALAQARAGLQAEAPAPDLEAMDLAAMRAAMAAAQAETAAAVEGVRGALEGRLGPRPRRAAPAAGIPLAGLRLGELTSQLVFGALGPTQAWAGWGEGPQAWGVLQALGLQVVSPWFGHYWPAPDRHVCDPARVQSMAATLGSAGIVMLLWLEPEYELDSLWAEIGEGMYLHDAAGKWQKSTRINNTINVFHPRVREELCRALERLASAHRGDARILGYELIEEPALRFDAADPGAAMIEPHYGGYSAAARDGFRQWLAQRYGDIPELNRRWGTAYAGFEAVQPPAQLARREGAWPEAELALLVEFQRFRAAGHAECFRQMVAALHRADPGRPVGPQFTTGLFGDPLGGVDLWSQAEAGWDLLTFHTDTAFAAVYSLARYHGKPLWNDEFIWTARSGRQPYITSKAMAGARALRAHASIELWRNLMWGARGVILFNLDFAWNHPKDGGDWNNELLNGQAGNRIPRYAAAVFATALPRARTFFAELRDSTVVNEGVLFLEPTTSLYAAVPTGTVEWWGTRLLAAGQRRFYRPAVCPERYLVEGREDLAGIRVVVTPPAPYVPAAVSARLHEWVRGGGTLISLGVFATHDEYGQRRPAGAPFAGDRAGATVPIGAGGHRVIGMQVPAEPVLEAVWDAVDAAVGARAVSATDTRLEVMLRRASGGHLLMALNSDAEATVAADVRLGLPVTRITDLTVDGGVPVPVAGSGQAVALPPLLLEPGEARAYWLE